MQTNPQFSIQQKQYIPADKYSQMLMTLIPMQNCMYMRTLLKMWKEAEKLSSSSLATSMIDYGKIKILMLHPKREKYAFVLCRCTYD
jgi:hypothetical protein